jgi:hypothetical protein
MEMMGFRQKKSAKLVAIGQICLRIEDYVQLREIPVAA